MRPPRRQTPAAVTSRSDHPSLWTTAEPHVFEQSPPGIGFPLTSDLSKAKTWTTSGETEGKIEQHEAWAMAYTGCSIEMTVCPGLGDDWHMKASWKTPIGENANQNQKREWFIAQSNGQARTAR